MTTKLNSTTWQTLDRNNKYFHFIDSCRTKDCGSSSHCHHIIPQYVFGKKPSPEGRDFIHSDENIIFLSPEDHTKAHELLYEVYGNKQDSGAVLLLNGYKSESRNIWRKLGAQKVHQMMEAKKRTFWDLNYQKEMSVRSMARPDALKTRSEGGKKGGCSTKAGIAIKKDDKFTFFYKKQPVLCIINCDSGTQVLEVLNKYIETPLQRVTPLLKGERKNLHGWSCQKVDLNSVSLTD